MTDIQYSKFNINAVFQITTVWTLCFLIGQLMDLAIGEALKNASWTIAENNIITYFPWGLFIAQTISGFFTALILRKTFSALKFLHILRDGS